MTASLNRARVKRRALAAAAAALALVACTSGTGASTAATDCTPRTAWAGSESSAQHGGGTFVQIPLREAVTLTRVTVSLAYAPRPSYSTGFAEVLLLVGVSDGPLTMADPLLPVMPADPAFGPLDVTTTKGQPHNENAALSDGVIAARIVKGPTGTALVDVPLDQPIPAGGVIWLRYDSVSDHALDPEVQIVASYTPAGCA